jgi:hypothetical protein
MIEHDNLSKIFDSDGFFQGIQTVAPRAFAHFIINLPNIPDIAVGGVHKEYNDAIRIQETLTRRALDLSIEAVVTQYRLATIRYLKEGEKFKLVGTGDTIFTHGEDDGCHDSVLKDPAARKLLRGLTIP